MKLNNFKEKIILDINESQLTIDGIYFVMKDIMNEITLLYNHELQKEQQLLDSEQQTSESNNENIEKKEEE